MSAAFSPEPSWDRKPGARVLAVLVVITVGLIGYASSRPEGEQAQRVVEKFFTALNDPSPRTSDFSSIVSGESYTRLAEAIRTKPTGTYQLTSLGEYTNGKVAVTFIHESETFTGNLTVSKVGSNWKIDKPFATVTFTAGEQDLRFRVNDKTTRRTQLSREAAYFPGKHTIIAEGSSSSQPPAWRPAEPHFLLSPGQTKVVNVTGVIDEEASAELRQRVETAFVDCLARSPRFRNSSCPLTVEEPADASLSPQVTWAIEPRPLNINVEDGSPLLEPCFVVSGTVTYTYDTRAGTRATGTIDSYQAIGCATTARRVLWKR